MTYYAYMPHSESWDRYISVTQAGRSDIIEHESVLAGRYLAVNLSGLTEEWAVTTSTSSDTAHSWRPDMGVLESVVARIPGAVIAVDGDLRVLALSPAAEKALGVLASEAQGRPCYEIMSAVDSESGRPCHEQCPLYRSHVGQGWAFNRVLDARWEGEEQTRLDCFLLKSQVSSTQSGQLCFLRPYTESKMDALVRGLQALEATSPANLISTDLKEVARVSLKAVLRATSADVAELLFLDPDTREPLLMESHERATSANADQQRSIIGRGILDATACSDVPLLAVGAWPQETSGKTSGWYVCAPLKAEGHIVGALGISSYRREFDIADAVRVLFSMVGQLALHLCLSLRPDGSKEHNSLDTPTDRIISLKFRCLGPFQVSVDGEPVPVERFERLKAFTLLKYLVAHRRGPISRETLMEVLWPGADPASSRGNLRVVLHALRRTLKPQFPGRETPSFIVSQGNLIYLALSDHIWVDAEELVQIAHRAARLAAEDRASEALRECRRAIALYQGDYLEGEPYDDWWLFERERLRELYVDVLKLMASIHYDQGDSLEAIEKYRAALGIDPGSEEVHRELMRLLWQSGMPDEALDQYEACRKLLREEIGVEPTHETETLRNVILKDMSIAGK